MHNQGIQLSNPIAYLRGMKETFFLCAIKSIVVGEELLINYNLNRVDTNMVTRDVVHPTIYPAFY